MLNPMRTCSTNYRVVEQVCIGFSILYFTTNKFGLEIYMKFYFCVYFITRMNFILLLKRLIVSQKWPPLFMTAFVYIPKELSDCQCKTNWLRPYVWRSNSTPVRFNTLFTNFVNHVFRVIRTNYCWVGFFATHDWNIFFHRTIES